MTDAVRRRRSILRLAADTKNIWDYKWNEDAFKIPVAIQAPPEVHTAMQTLIKRAMQAINGMKELRNLRKTRYNALCSFGLGVTYDIHASSMQRLLDWREDWTPNDPALAPSAKIPREALCFHINCDHYISFVSWYIHKVEMYMKGPFANYRGYLMEIEWLASRLMNEIDYKAWRKWWDETFRVEMFKWESCLEGLIMPTYEEVIDDVYLMVIDRVEGAEELINSLNVGGSPSDSPQGEQNLSNDGHFYSGAPVGACS